jgi:RNA polymerase-binding transcription factor DksA
MSTYDRREIENALRARRAELLREGAGREAALRTFAEEAESEIEERAQEAELDRTLARLDDHERHEIAEINAALDRLVEGTYGRCARCEDAIAPARLTALPEARLCVDCASEAERTPGGAAPLPPRSGVVPPDLGLFGDAEMAGLLREAVRADERIDDEELTISCRKGVVHLAGALPSHVERVLLRRVVQDVVGFRDVVERLRIDPTPWQRADRAKPLAHRRPRGFEPLATSDAVEAGEEGIAFLAPDRPPPDEES